MPAVRNHRELLTAWTQGFAQDIGQPLRRSPEVIVDEELAEGTTALWRNPAGEFVSMSAYGGATPHGIRIRKVYTTPAHRRHGYASACVAALSAQLLTEGRRFCFLNTDLANPTSNAIYQQIGYQPVCDVADFVLSPATSA